MSFLDQDHKARIKKIDQLWSQLHELQDFAHEYKIDDIFQDNGAKILQQLIYLNFKQLPGREGNDAISEHEIEWEMKSINLNTSASGFSTNHHTNQEIIDKYRKVPWTFAIYYGIKLTEIYIVLPETMEKIYQHWEQKLKTKTHLNNPKISVTWVRKNGIRVYPFDESNAIDPDIAAYESLKQ